MRNEIYAADEVTTYDGIPLTTPARTIFDLGRHLNRDAAVARIDALLWLGRVGVPDVEPIAARYPWARGVEKLRVALELADDGAESPRESRLRLLLTDAGMRPTDTQIPVYEGNRLITKFDMGWKQLRIGVQYEGKHHQTDRGQYVYDLQVLPKLEARNWIVVKVIKQPVEIPACQAVGRTIGGFAHGAGPLEIGARRQQPGTRRDFGDSLFGAPGDAVQPAIRPREFVTQGYGGEGGHCHPLAIDRIEAAKGIA